MADTDVEVLDKKEKLLSTVAELKRATTDAGGRLAQLETASAELANSYRELRAAHSSAQKYTPAGTDDEARGRYCFAADSIRTQALDVSNRAPDAAGRPQTVQYANVDKGEVSGREFVVGKGAGHGVRLLAEWDEDGHVEYGLLDDPEPATAWQHRLQEILEMRSLARMFMARANRFGLIERADMTLRLLDVKYYVLLPETDVVGGGRDYHQWTSVLRATSACSLTASPRAAKTSGAMW